MHCRRSTVRLLAAAGLALTLAARSVPVAAQAPPEGGSTVDQIKARGKLLVGCVPDLPYAGEDPRTGKWRGYVPLMAADIARLLRVDWECVPVTWGNAALALQAGKVDVILDLGATPERALVVDFIGPSNKQAFMMITRKGLTGVTWEDFNKPDVRVAVQVGTTNETILKLVAPKATEVGLAPGTDPSLAVSSGRADAFLSTFLTGTIAHAKNPGIGDLVLPTPIVSADSSIAFRYEADPRWRGFLQSWMTYNIKLGVIPNWVKQGLIESGVPAETLPELMHKAGY